MIHLLLADTLLLRDLAFLAFVVTGGLSLLRWTLPSRLPWLHLPAVLRGMIVELRGYICPPAPPENRPRQLGGEAGYAGGFVGRYLLPVIHRVGLTGERQIALGLGMATVKLAAYVRWRVQGCH